MSRRLQGAGVVVAACVCVRGSSRRSLRQRQRRSRRPRRKEQLREVESVESGAGARPTRRSPSATSPWRCPRSTAPMPSAAPARSSPARPTATEPGPYGGDWPDNAVENVVETPDFRRPLRRGPQLRRRRPPRRLRRARPRRRRRERHPRLRRRDRRRRRRVDRGRERRSSAGRFPRATATDGEPRQHRGIRPLRRLHLRPLRRERLRRASVTPTPDDNSAECNSAPFKCSSHLVNDNDYSEFGESGGQLGVRVTTAHEYNHVLQFNIDANQDAWMFETTATWMRGAGLPRRRRLGPQLHGDLDAT